jgi:endonuclease YncB( thermonuclease family)
MIEIGWLVLVTTAALILWAPAAPAEDLAGAAEIVDGDTLRIATHNIRLHGIDAPERSQRCLSSGTPWPCGRLATQGLAAAIDGRAVSCQGAKRDRYRRLIAVCHVGDVELNAFMVRNGWALAYRRYALDYVPEETEARGAGRGMWRGQFDEPWAWRQGERVVAQE